MTASRATVAQPNGARAELPLPDGLPGRRVERVDRSLPFAGGRANALLRADRALPRAEIDDRDEEPAAGVRHRRQRRRRAARGRRASAAAGSGPRSWRCVPTARDQSRRACGAVPGDDASRLARAEHDRGRRRSRGSATPGSRSRARRAGSPGRTRGACPWLRRARRASRCRAQGREPAPFGNAFDPPHGLGFAMPAYTLPRSSTLTGYQAPPPPASRDAATAP